jgi:hypothetical protein
LFAGELEIAVGKFDRDDRREHRPQHASRAALERAGLDCPLEAKQVAQIRGQPVGKRAYAGTSRRGRVIAA